MAIQDRRTNQLYSHSPGQLDRHAVSPRMPSHRPDYRKRETAEKGKGSDIQRHEGRESRHRVAIGHLQVRYGGWQNRFRRYDEDG